MTLNSIFVHNYFIDYFLYLPHSGYNMSCPNKLLMHPYAVDGRRSYQHSRCSVLDFQRSLFNESNHLKAKFQCLINGNTSKESRLETFKNIAHLSLPGFHLSLTNQCELGVFDPNSFTDQFTLEENKCKIRCYFDFTEQPTKRRNPYFQHKFVYYLIWLVL